MKAVKVTLKDRRSGDERGRSKDPAQVAYLVGEILATCRDAQSESFYRRVAQALPDEALFRFLAEVRSDAGIRKRGAVFTAKVKRYLQRGGGEDRVVGQPGAGGE